MRFLLFLFAPWLHARRYRCAAALYKSCAEDASRCAKKYRAEAERWEQQSEGWKRVALDLARAVNADEDPADFWKTGRAEP